MDRAPDSAAAAGLEDEPDRDMVMALVAEVHRTAHKMLWGQRLQRTLLMGDIAVIQAHVEADRARRKALSGGAGGSGGGGEPPDIGPEGAD